MKKIYLIALLALTTVWILRAQTNAANTNAVAEILALVTTNAPAPTPQPPRAPSRISSDSADFDLKGKQAVYYGHVRVDNPQIKLTCAQLTVNVPPEGGRINHVVAETNVVIDATDKKGDMNHVTCDKVVYDYAVQGAVTNEIFTFTGNPQIINAKGTNTADWIVWNRVNDDIKESNGNFIEAVSTNSAAANTNNFSMPNLF